MKRKSTPDQHVHGFRAAKTSNSQKVCFICRVYLCYHKTANLARSKQQYENNFQKDNSKKNVGSKAQVEKVFSYFRVQYCKKNVLTDIRTLKRKRDKFSGLTRRAKRRKLASEGETKEDRRAADAAIRSAKKAARPARISVPNEAPQKQKGDKLGKSGFSHDQGSRKEGIRAKRGDVAKAKIKGKGRRRTRR